MAGEDRWNKMLEADQVHDEKIVGNVEFMQTQADLLVSFSSPLSFPLLSSPSFSFLLFLAPSLSFILALSPSLSPCLSLFFPHSWLVSLAELLFGALKYAIDMQTRDPMGLFCFLSFHSFHL